MTLPNRTDREPAVRRGVRSASRLVIATTTATLMLGTSAAIAQPRLDRVAQRITQCVIDRNPESVRLWMRTLPGSREELQIAGRANWAFYNCLSASNGEDVWSYRADLQSSRERVAVALLARDFADLPAALPVSPAADSWIATSTADLARRRTFNRNAVQMLLFCDCLARSDWTNATKYVRSPAGSAEERGSMNALRPQMGGCLPPGLTASIDRSRLRALLSEAIYHILVDAGSAAGPAADRAQMTSDRGLVSEAAE